MIKKRKTGEKLDMPGNGIKSEVICVVGVQVGLFMRAHEPQRGEVNSIVVSINVCRVCFMVAPYCSILARSVPYAPDLREGRFQVPSLIFPN